MDLPTLRVEIGRITSLPIKYVYDTVAIPDTQKAAYDILGPGGSLVITLPSFLGDASQDGRKIINIEATPFRPENRDVGLGIYNNLFKYLEEGIIKVCSVDLVLSSTAH